MDAIAAIVTAIATGAAEALGSTTKLIVQDLYAVIKKRIQEKHPQANASLEALEKKPDSASKRESLKEDLQDSGADKDDDLLKQARALLTAIEEHAPQLAQAVGVNLEEVKAANLRLKEISVTGEQAMGVQIKKGEFSGDIEIGSVKVGAQSTKKS
jgi:hypothetical protein